MRIPVKVVDAIIFHYFVNGEGSALSVLRNRPVDGGTVATDTSDVQLQLASDTFLEVDDPLRLIGADFDPSDLSGKNRFYTSSSISIFSEPLPNPCCE